MQAKGINAKQCAECIAKLKWLDTQPKPKVSISDDTYAPKKTVSDFHNRLTQSAHL